MNNKVVDSHEAHMNDLNGEESPKAVVLNGESDVEDETQALLLPKKGGLSKTSTKPPRKVQWLDRNGDKLAEILEFQPSEPSDSDDDDSDSCICRIM